MLHAQVSPGDRARLHEAIHSATETKMYRRFKIIDLSSQGYSVPALAQLFDLSEATVRSYIHAYNHGGMTALQPAYGQGRPQLLNWSQAQWQDLLAQSPANLSRLDTQAHNWTQAHLRRYPKLYHQLAVSQPTLAKSLRRAGIRWRRAKLRVSPPTRSTWSSASGLRNSRSRRRPGR